MEADGLQKIESAVSGSEAEGFYGLLRGAVSYTSGSSIPPQPKKHHPAPTMTVSQPPPQKPEKMASEVSGLMAKKEKQAPEAHSLASSEAPEETISIHKQPLCLQMGGIKRVEGCTEGPSTSHATICAHVCRVHLGMGWCVLSVTNPSSIQTHSGATKKSF